MQVLIRFISQILFPTYCVCCNNPQKRTFICDKCKQNLNAFNQICFECRRGSFKGFTHKECENKTNVNQFITFFQYNDTLRKLLHTYKYKPCLQLKNTIIQLLEPRLKLFHIDQDTIITAIPLHKRKLKIRGFNQSKVLAQEIARLLSIEYKDLMHRTKFTKPQSKFKNFSERKCNVKDIFSLISNNNFSTLEKKSIILFDDVITSGETIRNAIKIINSLHPNRITVMCLGVSIKKELVT